MPTSHPTIKNNDDGQKKESHAAHETQTPKPNNPQFKFA